MPVHSTNGTDAGPARRVDEREHQLAVQGLDHRVVAAAAERQGNSRHQHLAGDPPASQLDSPEVALLDQGDAPVPVALPLVGEEVEVHLHPARELLVEPLAVVGGEIVDERNTAPHGRAG